LSASTDHPGIATVAQIAPGQFLVTSVNAGTCTISITDASGAHASVAVTVTTFGITVN
jgi:hypothetical protein